MKDAQSGHHATYPAIPITRQIFQSLAFVTAGVMFLTGAGLLISPADASLGAWAFGIGGAISLLPNAYFALRVLLVPAPLDAPLRLRQLYTAEVTKLLICALLFALVFTMLKALPPAWILTGFAVTHIGYLILSSWLVRRAPRQPKAKP